MPLEYIRDDANLTVREYGEPGMVLDIDYFGIERHLVLDAATVGDPASLAAKLEGANPHERPPTLWNRTVLRRLVVRCEAGRAAEIDWEAALRAAASHFGA